METKKKVISIILFLVSSLVIFSCKPSVQEPDKLSLQLNWFHEAEFTGYYVADALGFYKKENLDVEIIEGGLKIQNIDVFLKSEADVTIMAIQGQRKVMDSDRHPVAVAAALQYFPQVLFSLKKSGIIKPRDLIGKRMAVKNEIWRENIHKMLNNTGIDPGKIIEVNVEHDNIELLYNGTVDVWTGYVHDEPTEARLAGHEINLIFLAEYGLGAMDGLMVVSRDFLKNNTDLVERFVRASLRGWRYVVTHPEKAAETISKWQSGKSRKFHEMAVHALVPIIDSGQVPIGWIDEIRWKKEMGEKYNPKEPGYTMQFVQKDENK